jgi:hypothetical protein
VLSRATLYHDAATLTVEWSSRHADHRIVAGALVSIRWCGRPTSIGGAVRIARLAVLERPMPSLNLFATVLPSWVRDRALLKRAAKLWEALPLPYRHLLNAIFWDDNRFHRFVMGPSSLNGLITTVKATSGTALRLPSAPSHWPPETPLSAQMRSFLRRFSTMQEKPMNTAWPIVGLCSRTVAV